MTVMDTAGAIQAIDALSVEKCNLGCWCASAFSADVQSHSRYRWAPGDRIVRFPLGEETP